MRCWRRAGLSLYFGASEMGDDVNCARRIFQISSAYIRDGSAFVLHTTQRAGFAHFQEAISAHDTSQSPQTTCRSLAFKFRGVDWYGLPLPGRIRRRSTTQSGFSRASDVVHWLITRRRPRLLRLIPINAGNDLYNAIRQGRLLGFSFSRLSQSGVGKNRGEPRSRGGQS